MKTFSKFLLLITIFAFVTSSCNKKDDENDNSNNNNQNTATGMMTCKVDGADWSSTLPVVAVQTASPALVTVTGTDANSHQLQLTIYDYNGKGDYTLGETIDNLSTGRWTTSTTSEGTFSTMLGQGSGTVTITESSASGLKGTFSFTAKNGEGTEVSITNGSFEATFN